MANDLETKTVAIIASARPVSNTSADGIMCLVGLVDIMSTLAICGTCVSAIAALASHRGAPALAPRRPP